MCTKTQWIKVWYGNSTKKSETYLPTHNFWAWSSYTQKKKLKRPSNVNLKDLSNVLQCNFNLAKQVTYEKKLEHLEVDVLVPWEGSLGRKRTIDVNVNGSDCES